VVSFSKVFDPKKWEGLGEGIPLSRVRTENIKINEIGQLVPADPTKPWKIEII